MKLGVISDCFKRPMAESIALAGALGLEGIQMYAVGGDICPDTLLGNEKKLGEYKELLKKHGLTVSALCGDLGGHGFERAEENPVRIAKTKAIMDMALTFGTTVVTTHIGCVPHDETDPMYAVMQNALRELGEYGEKIGVSLAIETGPEPTAVLAKFLAPLPATVAVNYDPANLVMVTGDDPVAGVANLADRIVHTHVKDGLRLKESDAREVYGAFAEGGIECEKLGEYFCETPLGEGGVPMDAYFEALRVSGFDGFLTVEREVGESPYADIKIAVDYLKAKLGRE